MKKKIIAVAMVLSIAVTIQTKWYQVGGATTKGKRVRLKGREPIGGKFKKIRKKGKGASKRRVTVHGGTVVGGVRKPLRREKPEEEEE